MDGDAADNHASQLVVYGVRTDQADGGARSRII